MIVHDHKLIFVHVPKCAGRSIAEAFNQRFDHFTWNHFVKEYPKQAPQYISFAIVRNPYERFVSIYHYIKNHRRHRFEHIAMNVNGRMPEFKQWLITNLIAYESSFDINSPEGARGQDGQIGSKFWFSSQYSRLWAADGSQPDHIFKMDQIDAVEDFLKRITGLHITLKQENKSQDYTWQHYYDSELVSIVNHFNPLLEDIKMLNFNEL